MDEGTAKHNSHKWGFGIDLPAGLSGLGAKDIPPGARTEFTPKHTKTQYPSSPAEVRKKSMGPRNVILASLNPSDIQRLEPHFATAHLHIGEVIGEISARPARVWFPETCVLSLAVPMNGGGGAVVSIVGREGALGYRNADCEVTTLARLVVQVPGTAISISVAALRALPDVPRGLLVSLRRHTETMFAQVAQIAGCNALHPAEARLARFLLEIQDRIGRHAAIPATQEHLASVLGVQRTTITASAAALQRAGLINCRRGAIEILNRSGLEEFACECYSVLRLDLGSS